MEIRVKKPSGKIYGPYRRETIVRFIYEKKIHGNEKILAEGDSEWRDLSTDTEFFDCLQEVLFGIKAPRKKSKKKTAKTFIAETRLLDDPSKTRTAIQMEKTRQITRIADKVGKQDIDLPSPEEVAQEAKFVEKKWKPEVSAEIIQNTPLSNPGQAAQPLRGQTKKGRPKKRRSLMPFLLFLVIALGVLLYLEKTPGEKTKYKNLHYFNALEAQLKVLDLESLYPRGELVNDARVDLPAAISAKAFSEDLLELKKLQSQKGQMLSYWKRVLWNLLWLGKISENYRLDVSQRLKEQSSEIRAFLEEKELLDSRFKNLLLAASSFCDGKWEEVLSQIPANSGLEVSRFLRLQSRWFLYWEGQDTDLSAFKEQVEFEDTRMESVVKSQKLFFLKSQEALYWLTQIASVDPSSFFLWFNSAQYYWRVYSTGIQSSRKYFVTGLSVLSLYPRSMQRIYWDQYKELLNLLGRQSSAKKAATNVAMILKGNVEAVKEKPTNQWWDIGDEGLTIDKITNWAEENTRNFSVIELAALQNLSFVHPKGQSQLVKVAQHWIFEEDWNRALALLDQAAKLGSDSLAEVYGTRLWVYSRQFHFDKALEALARVQQVARYESDALLYSGILKFFGREYKSAESELKSYVQQVPNSGLGHFILAEFYLSREKNVDCVKSANLARQHAKGELGFRADMLFYRCRVLGGLDLQEALGYLERRHKNDPTNIPVIEELIRGLSNADLNDRAIKVGRQSVERFPRSFSLRLLLGDTYRKKGEYDYALAFYNDARRYRPDSAKAYIKIGDIFMSRERYKEAAENYRTAATLNPSTPEIWLLAARAYRKIGGNEQALRFYLRELEERPSILQNFLEVSEFLLEINAAKQVPEILNRYQRKFGEDPRISIRLAQAYLANHEFAKAKDRASYALAQNPQSPEANKILGLVYDFEGQYNTARKYFENYLALYPQAEDADKIKSHISQGPYKQ